MPEHANSGPQMSVPGGPPAALLIVAATSRFDEAFAWANQRVETHWGPVALSSDCFPFHQTEYYAPTMGQSLRKQLLASSRPFDPAELADCKRRAIDWEQQLRASRTWPVERPLNLDPGYLTLDKLVLASTKNHAHRIYLRDGIFAELTLQYRSGAWQPLPWTYPDYQTSDYHAFFTACREYLRRQIRSPRSG